MPKRIRQFSDVQKLYGDVSARGGGRGVISLRNGSKLTYRTTRSVKGKKIPRLKRSFEW